MTQCSLNRPVLQSIVERRVVNACAASPFSNDKRFPAMRNVAVVSLVAALLCAGSPSAIVFAVRPVDIVAFQCEPWRTRTHVRHERLVRVNPHRIDRDTPSAVIGVGRKARIQAARLHRFPRFVFAGQSAVAHCSVPDHSGQNSLIAETSTTLRSSCPEFLRGHHSLGTAITSALPIQPVVSRGWLRSDDEPTSEPLAADINACRHCGLHFSAMDAL